MTVGSFGRLSDGREVRRIVLGAEPGPVVHVLDLGATVHRVEVTGGDGRRRNVVLGHATAEDYRTSMAYFGGTIGRYANRIAGGRFRLDGQEVRLGVNDRGNHLHGGVEGFDKRLWTVVEHGPRHAVLALDSPDGDEGFPGALSVLARFEVSDTAVRIGYQAKAEATTVVNLTNHAYFNLDGDGAGTVDGHLLRVLAERFTPVDGTGIPLGDHASVGGTPFDFRTATPLGAAVRRRHDQLAAARGVDHNFVLDGSGWRLAAVLESPRSATRLELRTDQPGLQVYTGNFLDGSARSSEGLAYRQGDGIALEPQLFPDSPNHPDYPSAVIGPGDTYRAALEWAFSAIV
jgi:galactose mutarotase-like enzyme